jgi:hypothetical protein
VSTDKAENANDVHCTTVKGLLDPQLITAMFEQKGKGKVTFALTAHKDRVEGRDCSLGHGEQVSL